MRKKLLCVLVGMCAMVLASTPSYAAVGQLINVKLGASSAYSDGAAFNNVHPQIWNSFASAIQEDATPLVLAGGSGFKGNITYSMIGTNGLVPSGTSMGSPDTALFTGYLLTDNFHTGAFHITGLDSGTYDLYVYSQRETGQTTNLNLTVNGVDASLLNKSNSTLTELTLNENYVKRSVTVGSDGQLNFVVGQLGSNSYINGFQLYHSSSTPEPASLVLLGVGGLLGASRLKKKSGKTSVPAV